MWIAGLEAPPYYLLSVNPAIRVSVVLQFVAALLGDDDEDIRLVRNGIPLLPRGFIMGRQFFEPVNTLRVEERPEQQVPFWPLRRMPPFPHRIFPLRHEAVNMVSFPDPDGRPFMWGWFFEHRPSSWPALRPRGQLVPTSPATTGSAAGPDQLCTHTVSWSVLTSPEGSPHPQTESTE